MAKKHLHGWLIFIVNAGKFIKLYRTWILSNWFLPIAFLTQFYLIHPSSPSPQQIEANWHIEARTPSSCWSQSASNATRRHGRPCSHPTGSYGEQVGILMVPNEESFYLMDVSLLLAIHRCIIHIMGIYSMSFFTGMYLN